MRFLLLVHSPRSRWDELSTADTDEEMEAHLALIEELDSRGYLVDCSPLAPPEQAITVRVRDGTTLACENPAAENQAFDTEDALAGYYIIECPTTAAAVEVAARIPDAATSKVLVHPLLDLPAGPTGPRPSADG